MAAHRCLYVSIWHVVAVIAATVPSAWGQDDLWSLRPIQQSEQPALHPDHRQRVRTPIDRFVMARLANGGLDLSPPAERATYLRRVTLDLIGLLPTHIEVQEFLRDSRTDACERAVDRLLARSELALLIRVTPKLGAARAGRAQKNCAELRRIARRTTAPSQTRRGGRAACAPATARRARPPQECRSAA